MHFRSRHAFGRISITTLLTFTCVSCGGDDPEHEASEPICEEDTRDDAFTAGISKLGEAGYTVSIVDSLPAPPGKGDNRWSLVVTDDGSAPVSGMTLDIVPFMPDHGHGGSVIPVVSDDGDGAYTADPVNFFMPGYWETTITIVDPGASDGEDDDIDLDSVIFKFCIEG